MKTFKTVAWLSLPILVLALIAAGTGVLWQGAALIAMIVGMLLADVPVDLVQTVLSVIISLTRIGLLAVTLRSVEDMRAQEAAYARPQTS